MQIAQQSRDTVLSGAFARCLRRRLQALASSGALTRTSNEGGRAAIGASLHALVTDRRPLVRRLVVDCAQHLPQPARIDALLSLASDKNAEVRGAAVEVIGDVLQGASCPLVLIQLLRDTDILVRASAAAAIGQIGDKRVVTKLWPALRDRSPLVRSYVAAAIGRLGNSRCLGRLKARLRSDRSSTARVGLLEGISSLGDEAVAVEGLLRLLKAKDYRVRCATANSLAAMGVSGERATQVREGVAQALRIEETRAARQALRRALRSLRSSGCVLS